MTAETFAVLAGQSGNVTNSVLNQTTFNAGTTQFIFSAGGQTQNSILDLGTLSRNPGATPNISPVQNNGVLPSIRTTSTPTNGILGGWLTTQVNLPNNFAYDWATVDANRNIIPFTAYNTRDDLSTWTTNDNVNIDTASVTNSVPTVTINSLRTAANGSFTVSFSGLTTIASGGVLIQGNAIGSTITFAGAGGITSGTTDLILDLAGNSGTSIKQLTITTPIVDRVDPDTTVHPVGITKTQSGTLIILGSHTYSGDVYINQGSLNIDTMGNIGDPSGLGTSGTVYIGGEGAQGTLNFGSGGNTPVVGAVASNRNFVFGDAGANIRNQAGTITLSGSMSGGALTRFGTTGTTLIVGAKTYAGSVVVGAGTLDVNVIAAAGQPSGLGTGTLGSTVTLGNQNPAVLNYSGLVDAATDRAFSLANDGAGLKVENGTLSPVTLTLTGQVSGGVDFHKYGTGTLAFSGTKSYSGTLTVDNGDLRVDTVGGVGTGAAAGAATITIGRTNTATLTFSGASGTINRPITLNPQATQFGGVEVTTGSLALSGVIDTNNRALAADGAGTLVFSGAIVGDGSLNKNGSGAVLFSASSGHAGGTIINSGSVILGSNGIGIAARVNSAKVVSGTTINPAGLLDLGGQTVSESLTLNGGSLVNNGAAATISTGIKGFTPSGPATTIAGDATVSIASTPTGSGAAAIPVLGMTSASFTLSNAGSGYTSAPVVTITGGGGTGATAVATINATTKVVTSVTLTNPGYGYTTAPTFTFTGGAGVNAAVTANASSFSFLGLTTVSNGDGYLTGPTATLNSSTGNGGITAITSVASSVVLQANSTIGGTGDMLIEPPISGSGGLIKAGTNTVTLSGSNSYTGNTTVQSGTLMLTGANAWAPILAGPGFTNITGGRVVLNYGVGTSPKTTVQSLLTSSFASGFATGQLRSTTADSHRGLGWADNGTNKVMIAYTYFGDANLDGMVDTNDFTEMAANFNSTGATWQTGDFNYDGVVNALDFNYIATNFGSPAITAPPVLGALVPEPAAISLVMVSGLALLRRRHKA